ncbi:hypothetical protein [Paraclostridium sordellii]|uniref:Uncharacterized protein n=1 Tax=Paraclostridium sordellii TaxID=1505 RepID=A0A0C7R204_PARSO|nr:hypothetical protein [Paeniclostridium sordellii]CEN78127.1 Uncharacterised protein [[Clostridium] sordellii] [Paeniclostridium sordellii]CEQ03213.1 Uncharacterised protein [[Clostridium] sordellii] [Paeniclostridium sordellii]
MKKETFLSLSPLIAILLFFNVVNLKNILRANIIISLALVIISGKLLSEVLKFKNNTN